MEQLGIALISLLNNKWAKEIIIEGHSAVDLVKEKLNRFPDIKQWHFIADNNNDNKYYIERFSGTSTVKNEIYPFLEECVKVFSDCENILFLYTDSPLNDVKVLKELVELHIDEMVEYSFTENYPEGVGAEVLNYSTLKKLKNIASGNNEVLNRKSISRIIHFDINRYDVEVLVSEKDMRKERLSLICNDKRNFLIVQKAYNLLKKNNKTNIFQEIYEIVNEHPEFMRTTPAYVEIEITNDCNCKCDICPRTRLINREIQNMPFEKYKSIIDELKSFCDEVTIALTLMGEPSLHPKLLDIIKYTLSIEGMTLILETNALFDDNSIMDELSQFDSTRFIIIIALDSPNSDLYKALRGVDELSKVENNAAYLLKKKPENTYLQILRLNENENFLDNYYQRWEAFKNQIILQKFNPYRGQLENRKGADLSPLKRFSCWHLKRDMTILSDGTISFCKQDVNGDYSQGNAFTDGIEVVWNKMEADFIEDHKGNINPFCKDCDEWFTYNF